MPTFIDIYWTGSVWRMSPYKLIVMFRSYKKTIANRQPFRITRLAVRFVTENRSFRRRSSAENTNLQLTAKHGNDMIGGKVYPPGWMLSRKKCLAVDAFKPVQFQRDRRDRLIEAIHRCLLACLPACQIDSSLWKGHEIVFLLLAQDY